MHQPGEPHVDLILDRIKQVIARDNRPGDGGRAPRTGLSPLVSPRAVPPTQEDYAAGYAIDEGGAMEPADAEEAAEVLQLDEDEIMPHTGMRLADDDPPGGRVPQNDGDALYAEETYGGETYADADDDLLAHGWADPEGLGAAGHDFADATRDAAGQAAPAADAPLTRADTRVAMRDNLAALSTLSALSRERQARGLDAVSIDGLARDLLRPMLAEWLDTNLPPMVERLVQAEISRIVGEG